MPASAQIVQLRQFLAERFPLAQWSREVPGAELDHGYLTGVAQIDALGGLPAGALSEIVTPRTGAGSAMLLQSLLLNAITTGRLVALVDGSDSFDPCLFPDPVLGNLLWVRCGRADESLKVVDLLLRDRNIPLVLVDLQLNSWPQLKKISTSTWFRFQRMVEQTSTVCTIFTPQPIVAAAKARFMVTGAFDLTSATVADRGLLLARIKVEVAESHIEQARGFQQHTA